MESVGGHCPILYMTYGIFIQDLLYKEDLPYTHIVLDEVHERSLDMDFCFVALKNLLNKRIDEGKTTIKLIVMSATLNFELFANYFATDRDTNKFFIPEVKKKKEENYYRENYSRFNQIRTEKNITSFY